MTVELEASMIAISAAAHAIDGFYGEMAGRATIPPATRASCERNNTKRPGRILETLKSAYKIGPKASRSAAELEWLFALRDAALHNAPRATETVPHPMGGTNVGKEYAVLTSKSLSLWLGCALRSATESACQEDVRDRSNGVLALFDDMPRRTVMAYQSQ